MKINLSSRELVSKAIGKVSKDFIIISASAFTEKTAAGSKVIRESSQIRESNLTPPPAFNYSLMGPLSSILEARIPNYYTTGSLKKLVGQSYLWSDIYILRSSEKTKLFNGSSTLAIERGDQGKDSKVFLTIHSHAELGKVTLCLSSISPKAAAANISPILIVAIDDVHYGTVHRFLTDRIRVFIDMCVKDYCDVMGLRAAVEETLTDAISYVKVASASE